MLLDRRRKIRRLKDKNKNQEMWHGSHGDIKALIIGSSFFFFFFLAESTGVVSNVGAVKDVFKR